jgi:four helix bundle protein
MAMAERENPVLDKSYAFAVEIVKTVRIIQSEQREYVLTKQLLRSGTSIGANVAEGNAAQTKKDFIAKMAIASKEARETHYWLRLVRDTQLLDARQASQMIEKADELIRLLTAIVKSAQQNG